MFGYIPELEDYEPKPKTVSKAVIAAKKEGAESAMEIMREAAERATGKKHAWIEDGDNYTLTEI